MPHLEFKVKVPTLSQRTREGWGAGELHELWRRMRTAGSSPAFGGLGMTGALGGVAILQGFFSRADGALLQDDSFGDGEAGEGARSTLA